MSEMFFKDFFDETTVYDYNMHVAEVVKLPTITICAESTDWTDQGVNTGAVLLNV